MSVLRTVSAAALACCAACGVINGLSGNTPIPAELTWHGPVQLDQGVSPQSDQPRLAFGQGKLWLAWQAYDKGAARGSVWVTNRPIRGSWAAPQALPQLPGWDGGEWFPHLAVGAVGEPVLAVSADTSDAQPVRSIWATRLHGGLTATLSDLVRVDPVDSRTPQLSQANALAVDAAGNAVLVWGEDRGVYASASVGGPSWSAAALLDAGGAFYSWPSIDVTAGAAGQAFAGWARGSPSATVAQPLGLSGGALVPGDQKILASGTNLPGPKLAMQGGRVLAAWANGGTVSSQPWEQSAWGLPAPVATGGVSVYSFLTLAMNSKGQAVAVWRDDSSSTGSYAGMLRAAFWNGGGWTSPELISHIGAGQKAWWQAVDLDDTGTAVCAWADFDSTGTYTRIWANVLRFGTGTPAWGGPVAIDQDSPGVYLADKPENARDISVRLDPHGAGAYVVWIQHGQGSDPTSRTWGNWLE